MLVLYPTVLGASREYRTDAGVINYQIPAEEGKRTSILESIVVRRTWCVRQRLLWLEEIFCSKKELIEISIRADGGLQPGRPDGEEAREEWNLLNNYTKQYLTRKISAGKKLTLSPSSIAKYRPRTYSTRKNRLCAGRIVIAAFLQRWMLLFPDTAAYSSIVLGKGDLRIAKIHYGRPYSGLSLPVLYIIERITISARLLRSLGIISLTPCICSVALYPCSL